MILNADSTNDSQELGDHKDILARIKDEYEKNKGKFISFATVSSILLLVFSTLFGNFLLIYILAIMASGLGIINYLMFNELLIKPVIRSSEIISEITDFNFTPLLDIETFPEIESLPESIIKLNSTLSHRYAVQKQVVDVISGHSQLIDENMRLSRNSLDDVFLDLNSLTIKLSQSQDEFEKSSNLLTQFKGSIYAVTNELADLKASINSIAKQTNMLALNASIEAAKAGKYGRGFEVVANNIQSLVEQTKRTSIRLDGLRHELEDGSAAITDHVVEGLQEFEQSIMQYGEMVNRLSSNLEKSAVGIQNVSRSNFEIEEVGKDLRNIL